MSYSQIKTRCEFNGTTQRVAIETNIRTGNQKCTIIGMPETQVRESIDRVSSAIIASGYSMPEDHITINLTPGNIPKRGCHFDLAIALGILLAAKQIKNNCKQEIEVFGELRLDGKITGSKDYMPLIYQTWLDQTELIYPKNIEPLVKYMDGIQAYATYNLKSAICFLSAQEKATKTITVQIPTKSQETKAFLGIIGQSFTKRALSIAAAGGHHTLLIGAPGAGKTLLANAMHKILPELTNKQAIEAMCISGNEPTKTPNFRAPHHAITAAGLLGGGLPIQMGEITRAHLGLLFTDELTEYHRSTLEMMREPVEQGKITIARMGATIELPCKFQWIAALNPCPCGMYGHPTETCRCNSTKRQQYINKLSQPLLDRFAIKCKVDPIPKPEPDFHFSIAEINAAHQAQHLRFGVCSQRLLPSQVAQLQLTKTARTTLEIINNNMPERKKHQLLKVAQTISDLKKSPQITKDFLLEAKLYL